jgi:integrase
LAPLVFVRPGELRMAEWVEFDLEEAEWRIPATRMKMRTPHFVPLASQAIEILQQLHPLTGARRFVFPGERSRDRPMSNNTVNAALRRLGYTNEQMTGHGFRSMASTLLNEQGWHPDAIERQLAHQEPNDIRAACGLPLSLALRGLGDPAKERQAGLQAQTQDSRSTEERLRNV